MFTATLEDQVVPEMEANGDRASFSLQCQVTGNPTPTITWFRGGIKIDGETAATLTVDPIVAGTDATIAGVEYYCEANNIFGRIRSRRALVQLASECCVLVKCDVGEPCSYAELCLTVLPLQLLETGLCRQKQGPSVLAQGSVWPSNVPLPLPTQHHVWSGRKMVSPLLPETP